jgi:hypothetical protein
LPFGVGCGSAADTVTVDDCEELNIPIPITAKAIAPKIISDVNFEKRFSVFLLDTLLSDPELIYLCSF